MGQRAVMLKEQLDERVIEDCRRGDRDAFHLLFEAYKERVYSISLYYFRGDEERARDVTQQVFLKLITSIAQFRRDAEFTTWLYRLVVNACTDEERKRRRFLPFGESFEMSTGKRSVEERYARSEIAESVRREIEKLKPKLRLPILLRYVEGLSYEEMAEVLNCSKGTVASRLNRGHKILARRLAHLRESIALGD